jgi:hypothetical protein
MLDHVSGGGGTRNPKTGKDIQGCASVSSRRCSDFRESLPTPTLDEHSYQKNGWKANDGQKQKSFNLTMINREGAGYRSRFIDQADAL